MPFELFIAFRYLLARRKQAFISVISFISTLGVAVGVMALIIALALMTGLQEELRDRILGSTAHVYVWKTGGIEDYQAEVRKMLMVPGVIGAGPAIQGKALISSAQGQSFISLKGIDPELEARVTDIGAAMQQGSVADVAAAVEGEPDGILIGRQLADSLVVRVGDPVSLITDQGILTPMGARARFVLIATVLETLGTPEVPVTVIGSVVAEHTGEAWAVDAGGERYAPPSAGWDHLRAKATTP